MQFDFGENWKQFSINILSPEGIKQAKSDFLALIDNLDIKNKSFLDIGFGQGLSLLTATALGASTVGCDINPKCGDVISANRVHFEELQNKNIPIVIGSILEQKTLDQIKAINSSYDIVHSWGVLHHTGDMQTAINNSLSLVKPGGLFILSIYNKHWSSPAWLLIKWFYNIAPKLIQYLMIKVFYVIIYVAKFLVTFKNPLIKNRGMNFYYDVIDWLGGYPYEYASISEITNFVEAAGFKAIKIIASETPTGCNEFIFRNEKTPHN